MEKTIKEMRERHKREIEEFQRNCKHKDVSDWVEEWWAPGHLTGYEVKVCEICEKVIKRRKIRDKGTPI